MDSVTKFLQPYQLHPQVDHFSVALLITAVLIDLISSLAPTRIWLRYTALTLMILGAIAAGGSFLTGGAEADRIWKALGQPAKDVLKTHAELGEYLAITFGILTVWRLLIQVAGFMAGSRFIYLIVAVVAIFVLGYQSHLGGVLVFDYGAGTSLMAAAPVPQESASPAASSPTSSGPIPTVSVPTPLPTPIPPSAPGASAPMESTPTPQPTSSVNM